MTRLLYILCAFNISIFYCNLTYAEFDESLFDLSLQELLKIQVTGSTLSEQTIDKVPSAVTVFDEAFISSLGIDYLHELLNYVAGFQSHRSADTPNSYGYSARGRRNGNQSKEILLLLDGRVLNDPRTGAANSAVRMLSVRQIERVEIIRGPGSALYGSGAYGGVINITTRKEVNDWQVQRGQHNRFGASGNVYKKLNNWQLNLFASHYEDKGEEYVLDDNFNNNQSVKVTSYDPLKKSDFHITLNNEFSTVGFVYHNTTSDDFYSIETLSNGFSFNQSKMKMLYAKQKYSLYQDVDSFFSISLIQVDQNLDSQATAPGSLAAISSPSSDDPLFLKAYIKSRGLRFSLHNDWLYLPQVSIQFGINGQINDEVISEAANNFNAIQLSNNDFPIDYFGDFTHISRADHQDLQKIIGLYGHSIITANDTNQFNLGLRFDRNQVKQSHASPRLGWVHQLGGHKIFKLLYGEAFRVASLNETASPNSPILRGSKSLDHEVVKTLDIIYLYQQTDMNAQLGLFFNEYLDPIIVEIADDNVRQYVNGKASSGQGVEAEINYSINQSFSLRVSYFEIFNKPKDFYREASRHASVMINWKRYNWQGSLSTIYGGNKEMLTGEDKLTLHEYAIFSGKFKYKFNSKINIKLQIKNIFDENYYSAAQGNRLIEGIPNPGRESSIELNYQFE